MELLLRYYHTVRFWYSYIPIIQLWFCSSEGSDFVKQEAKNKEKQLVFLPLFGFGKLSCRWKTTFSMKCWMLLCSAPRTNTIQSCVNPSTVGFFLTWARWPSSSFTWTAPWKKRIHYNNVIVYFYSKNNKNPTFYHNIILYENIIPHLINWSEKQ